MHRLLQRQLRKLGIEGPPTREQWAALLERIDRAYCEADQDRYTQERALELSSAEMRKRYVELRDAQRALLEASRKAGMADVAASVLHNVGNVLNSANVSTKVLGDCVKQSELGKLNKALTMLGEQPEPGRFIEEHPRGKKLISYLTTLDSRLTGERARLLSELEALNKHIEHIKAVVSDQLAAARHAAHGIVLERIPLDDLIRDSIEVSQVLMLPGADVVCELQSFVVETDRHKITQILVNLLRNAYEAIAMTNSPGTITVRARRGTGCSATVEVTDTGAGIAGEMRHRIFSHGFTTKTEGNGYGLHHSACAVIELGGTLSCASPGVGQGATFTLTFPRKRVAKSSCDRLAAKADRVLESAE